MTTRSLGILQKPRAVSSLILAGFVGIVTVACWHDSGWAQPPVQLVPDAKQTVTYARIRAYLDSIRAIDTHDHLEFDKVPGLYTLWRESYFDTFIPALAPKDRHVPVGTWWPLVQTAFANGRTMSFYRYQLPAFRDLYGVDFHRLTMAQAERNVPTMNGSIWSPRTASCGGPTRSMPKGFTAQRSSRASAWPRC